MSRFRTYAVCLFGLLVFGCTASGGGSAGLVGEECLTSGNCGGSPCVPVGGTRRVCSLDCDVNADCPDGWACEAFGGVGEVCRCDVEPELCDGDDDDCDGVVDEDCGEPSCGDGVCAGAEDCSSCADDCGACADGCGDLTCSESESCATCAPDCGECAVVCGDGICAPSDETCESCAEDCGECGPSCGDGTCDDGEACDSCAEDCGPCCADGGEEPNDTESTSMRQGRPAPYSCIYEDSFGGVLAGDSDEDWFSVPSSDTRAGGCTHSVTVDSPGLALCVYGSCAVAGATPSTTCVSGSVAVSPGGKPGCCTTAGPAAMRIVCTEGSSTATTFLVHVSGAAPLECLDYTVSFSGTSP